MCMWNYFKAAILTIGVLSLLFVGPIIALIVGILGTIFIVFITIKTDMDSADKDKDEY